MLRQLGGIVRFGECEGPPRASMAGKDFVYRAAALTIAMLQLIGCRSIRASSVARFTTTSLLAEAGEAAG